MSGANYERASLKITTPRPAPGINSEATASNNRDEKKAEIDKINKDLGKQIIEILALNNTPIILNARNAYRARNNVILIPRIQPKTNHNGDNSSGDISVIWIPSLGENFGKNYTTEEIIKQDIYKTAKYPDPENPNRRVFNQTSYGYPLTITQETYEHLSESETGKTLLNQHPELFPEPIKSR